MSAGSLFFLLAMLIAFLTAASIWVIPHAELWCLFCLALGLLLNGIPVPWRGRSAA